MAARRLILSICTLVVWLVPAHGSAQIDSGSIFTWKESVAECPLAPDHDDVNAILDALSDEQKKRWMIGIGMRNYVGVIDWRSDPKSRDKVEPLKAPLPPGVSVPPLFMMDNGQGFRNDAGAPGMSTVFPPGAALGMTWDVDTAREFGALLGRLFKHRGANVILGPGLTMMRTPFGARNWEYISGEEPVLGGVLGAAFAQGARSEHVLTQAKHFVDNHQELDRKNMVASMDIATQMEVHMKPFEYFLRFGGGGSVMCGYNRVHISEEAIAEEDEMEFDWENAPWECEQAITMQYAKRKYPAFWVGSDWWAVRHAAIEGAEALWRGLDQEMPGNADGSGDAFTESMLDAQMGSVNSSVWRSLRALQAHGMLSRGAWPAAWADAHAEGVSAGEAYQTFEKSNGCATNFTREQLREGAAFARRAVVESAVLLRNARDALPLRSRRLSDLEGGKLSDPGGGGDGQGGSGTAGGGAKGGGGGGGLRENVVGVEAGGERVGLFGCEATPAGGPEVDWAGFFVSGGGSGAVTWARHSGQVRGLDDEEEGIPSVLSPAGSVFHVRRGDHPAPHSCDIAVVCFSAFAAEEYAMPNQGDRTALHAHTMWGTPRDEDGYPGMPHEVSEAGCALRIAIISAPGHVSRTRLPGREGLGDFDAVVYTVFPGEMFGPALTDLLWARGGRAFEGKLSLSLPEVDADVAHFVPHAGVTRYLERGAIGHRWFQQQHTAPAYPFGYGLSYTLLRLHGVPDWVVVPVAAASAGPADNLNRQCPQQASEQKGRGVWWAFRNVCVENAGAEFTASEVVQFYFQRRQRPGGPEPENGDRDAGDEPVGGAGGGPASEYLELAHFVKVKGVAPGSVACVEETVFAPPQRWDAAAADMVDLKPEEVRMYVATQGVGWSRFKFSAAAGARAGAASATGAERAGKGNSVGAAIAWEPTELPFVQPGPASGLGDEPRLVPS